MTLLDFSQWPFHVLHQALDLESVVVVQTTTCLTLTVVLLSVTRGRAYRGLGIWTWGLVINTPFMPFFPKSLLGPVVSVLLTSGLLFLNAALIRFRELDRRNPTFLCLASILLINVFTFAHPALRLILINILYISQIGMVLMTLRTSKGKAVAGKGQYLLMLAIGIQCALSLSRMHLGMAHQFGWTVEDWYPMIPRSEVMIILMTTSILYSLALLIMVMEASMAESRYLLNRDAVTGIWNRRKAEELGAESQTKSTLRRPRSILMADIDHFKTINDTFGHNTGDRVLRQFAASLNSALRTSDWLCRWGGEEFLVLMPDTDFETAATLAERLRMQVEQVSFDPAPHLTASFGYTQAIDGEPWTETVNRADQALYQAKAQGRNRTHGIQKKNDFCE